MRILRTIVILLAVTLAVIQKAHGSFADKRFSLFVHTGYGFGIGGVNSVGREDLSSETDDATGLLVEKKDHYLNYGSGFKTGLGVHYLFFENLAAQCELEYTGGVPRLEVEREDLSNNTVERITFRRNVFGIKVIALPTINLRDRMDLHVGAGCGLFFAGVEYENSEEPYEGKINTTAAFAFIGKAGIDYPLGDVISIFGYFAFEAMNFTLQSQRLPQNNNTIYYVKNSTASNEETPEKIPGSNVSLRVGIRFALF